MFFYKPQAVPIQLEPRIAAAPTLPQTAPPDSPLAARGRSSVQCSKLILIWLAAAKDWGMSHYPRVMLTVTSEGVSLAKWRQERPAQQAGEALGAHKRRPHDWSREPPSLALATSAQIFSTGNNK